MNSGLLAPQKAVLLLKDCEGVLVEFGGVRFLCTPQRPSACSEKRHVDD